MWGNVFQAIQARTTYTLTVFILTLLALLAAPGLAEGSNTATRTESTVPPPYVISEFERNAPFPGEDSTPWPRGDVTLGGVPFRIPEMDPSVWKSEDPFLTGPNPRTLDILVNQQGVNRVYTLINTGGGAPGPTAYAWLEFWGDDGAYFRKDLVGDVDIRDYNYDGWTNTINGTTTVNVFLHNPGVYNGERRLDMQIIDLPAAFVAQTLTHMRLSDNGGDNLQRTILEGVTVQTQPVYYIFSGFFQPIDDAQPNSAKAGQMIPVKWRLTDAVEQPVSDPASFVSLTSSTAPGGCGGTADAIETYAGSSGLQYLGDGNWQYNWKTPKTYAGQCRIMSLNLKDGSSRTAVFEFK